MDQSKGLEEKLDEFQKIVVYLNNIDEKMSDENQATRNLKIKKERKDGELLMARGKSDKKSWKGKEKSSRMNSKGEARKCFLCYKEGHFKKHCPLNNSNEASSSKHAAKTSEMNVTDGYDSAETTDGYDSAETTDGYDSAKGTGSVQIATRDGMIKMLTSVRYVPEIKRNLISLGELNRSGTVVSGSAAMILEQKKQQTVDHVVIESQQERTLINEGVCSDSIAFDSKKQWKDVVEVELFILQKNQTWSLVTKPHLQKLIQLKWFKPGGDSKPKYKARYIFFVLGNKKEKKKIGTREGAAANTVEKERNFSAHKTRKLKHFPVVFCARALGAVFFRVSLGDSSIDIRRGLDCGLAIVLAAVSNRQR
ncbi:copia retroelement pol polyprotein-like [Cucumis melo var. makuwa]|uniref:Copia retroelement pol polyprotein-like n=1 Tax=Cucumis melo var. makuwa TaxID=1194695 RepID=A0A5D3DU26_CUCMM|nr:copia retroelement pol polyprotein-like [Cucumis melo var. makuwa]